MHISNKVLVVIPARGGSKGIPYKNIKELGGKPLIIYSLDIARELFSDVNICITTDDKRIVDTVASYGYTTPFLRPEYLATDNVGTQEVLLHALHFYEEQGMQYDVILLLQPTSPFRLKRHLEEALNLYHADWDMVVSVKESVSNPYYNVYEEDESGFLKISKGDGRFIRRQDAPKVWENNGSIYVINCLSLKNMNMSDFTKVVKYPMEELYSIDIDTPFDWMIAMSILDSKMSLC